METSVVMKRELFECEIRQDSKTSFFNLNDLEIAGNYYRKNDKKSLFSLNSWINSNPTKEFIEELERQFGEVVKTKKGRYGGTWAHPFLFIDMALAIDPKLKIEAYKFLVDELLRFRNSSGDSYKKMCGALYDNCSNKSTFPSLIKSTAMTIQEYCGVDNWQSATEEQLKLRDKIHENIALLCDVLRDNAKAVELGILKTQLQ